MPLCAALCRFVPLRKIGGDMFGLSGSFALPFDGKLTQMVDFLDLRDAA
jgi:hypothetical protein